MPKDSENQGLGRITRNILHPKNVIKLCVLGMALVACGTLLAVIYKDNIGYAICVAYNLICPTQEEPVKTKIRRYFSIKSGERLSETSIRKAVLAQLPIGSTSAAIFAYFAKVGLTKDKQIWLYGNTDTAEIICRFNYDEQSYNLVKTLYIIIFDMGKNRQLTDVSVSKALTGPRVLFSRVQ